jgi:hypothetical protein
MKQISLLLVAIILFAACNNSKPKDATIVSSDGKEKVTIDVNKMQNAAEDMKKETEELQKLTPLSLEQLKALVPETLMGAKRSKYNTTSGMGTGVATAEYSSNDTTNVRLTIYDCAGPAGVGIYSMQYLGMFNVQSESDEEYTKTVDLMGGKAFEHCQKTRQECTITYFTGSRFLVSLEGNNVGADALKQGAKELNIK